MKNMSLRMAFVTHTFYGGLLLVFVMKREETTELLDGCEAEHSVVFFYNKRKLLKWEECYF